jgi:monoamine oxidase
MQQLQSGMDAVPKAFAEKCQDGSDDPLMNCITFGARVKRIAEVGATGGNPTTGQSKLVCLYDNPAGQECSVESDFLILASPYTAQRAIAKDHAFDPKQEMAIRDVRYVEVTKVLLQYKMRWWKDVFQKLGQDTDGGVVCDLPIRYTMLPKEADEHGQTVDQFRHTDRGAIMAAYTFEQDATILGALCPARRTQLVAQNLDAIFPDVDSLALLEAGNAQVFPPDSTWYGAALRLKDTDKDICHGRTIRPPAIRSRDDDLDQSPTVLPR